MILGFKCHREAEVAFGVFMAAVDFGVIGKRHELLEGPVHLFGRALEEATAARSEQRVAAKEIITEQIGNMASGVAWDKKNLSSFLTDNDLVSFINPVR